MPTKILIIPNVTMKGWTLPFDTITPVMTPPSVVRNKAINSDGRGPKYFIPATMRVKMPA